MKKQIGYTLIEIMIALLLGLIVVAATINIYIATVSSSSSTIKSARLNHDLESVMTLMINDIKRAGYWGGATVNVDSRNNPFTAATTNIQISNKTGEVAQSCILYSYDGDSDGTVELNEYYGFRLDSNSIKIRKAVTVFTATTCNDVTWEEFIDGSQLTITALNFSFVPVAAASPFPALPATSRCLNITTNLATPRTGVPIDTSIDPWCSPSPSSGDSFAQKRLVNIQIRGQLINDSTVTKTLSGTVEVRNNRVLTQP